MKKLKRSLAVLLALVLLICTAAVPAFALEANKVTFVVEDAADGSAITDAEIVITYEEEDEDWNTYTETAHPNSDGTYDLYRYYNYDVKVTKDGYADYSETYSPDVSGKTITKTIKLNKKTADYETANAFKERFDAETGALRPQYGTDTNICEFVKAKLAGYTGLDSTGVTVALKSADTPERIAADGTITYVNGGLDASGLNFANVGCVFTFKCGSASVDTKERTATVCWDRKHYNSKINEEADSLSFDKIKGENASADEVTKNLSLPQILGTSARSSWSVLSWTSGDSGIISVGEASALTTPVTATVTRPEKDTKVTLTATFKANDSNLNSYVEKPEDFATVTKTVDVTVKGTGSAAPSGEELLAILNKYYTSDRIKDYDTQGDVDLSAVTGDLQLPRYTRIKDEDGNYVFNNKEITVTSSDDSLAKVNGYRVAIDPFASGDGKAELTVSFTREGVTVSKNIPVAVVMLNDAALDPEIAKMETAKAHYFDAINDKQYAGKDSVTGDLHPFQSIVVNSDSTVSCVYNVAELTGTGIIADGYFDTDQSEQMEAAGYNKFKSSDTSIISHESLVVTRPEKSKKVTVTSWLSSEKYGELAKKHPDNEKLQKLYKQEVSVELTVVGTKDQTEPGGSEDPGSAGATEAKVTIVFQEQKSTLGTVYEGFAVSSGDAAKYGYEKPAGFENKVTVLDAMAAMMADKYTDFKDHPEQYLKYSGGFGSLMIGKALTYNFGFFINDKYPVYADRPKTGSVAGDTVLADGDYLAIFGYFSPYYADKYVYFSDRDVTAESGTEFTVNVLGYYAMMDHTPAAQEGVTVAVLKDGTQVTTAVADKDGSAKFKIDDAGDYVLTVVSIPNDEKWGDYFVAPYGKLKVNASAEPGTNPDEPGEPGEPHDYQIISGSGSEWKKDSESGLTLTADGPFEKFKSVSVDGSVISADNYTAVSGSTVVTLKPAYLKTLSEGTHTISIAFSGGKADGTFKIAAASNPEDPTKPNDPENPADPTNPENPSKPENPSNPENPAKQDNGKVPATGDASQPYAWYALSLAAAAAYAAAIRRRRADR